jgi:hypothetical protein
MKKSGIGFDQVYDYRREGNEGAGRKDPTVQDS